MSGATTVSLVGVGGQGILVATAVLAQAAIIEGLDVKASEVKGMSQRGGSVLSMVRFGRPVWSPVARCSDVVIAMEQLEGRRALSTLAARGSLVCATTVIAPGSVLRGEAEYPHDLAAAAAERHVGLVLVDADGLALEAGTARSTNMVMLGAASTVLSFAEASWEQSLEKTIKAAHLAVNQRAFALGRAAASTMEVKS